MSWHDLNPHVLNSLICLLGIGVCLALIVGGMVSDRRERVAEAKAARAQAATLARVADGPVRRRASPSPAARVEYRQVA